MIASRFNKIQLFIASNEINSLLLQANLKKKLTNKIDMAGTRTFTMIKPDGVEDNNIGNILQMITDGGFTIKAMKLTRLSTEQAQEFYAIHAERPFYGELVEYMTSGPIIAAILEKDNAVEDFRKLIGATNPAEAAEGTIRAKYAESIGRNAVHGSDSDENAEIEGNFHFPVAEVVA